MAVAPGENRLTFSLVFACFLIVGFFLAAVPTTQRTRVWGITVGCAADHTVIVAFTAKSARDRFSIGQAATVPVRERVADVGGVFRVKGLEERVSTERHLSSLLVAIGQREVLPAANQLLFIELESVDEGCSRLNGSFGKVLRLMLEGDEVPFGCLLIPDSEALFSGICPHAP